MAYLRTGGADLLRGAGDATPAGLRRVSDSTRWTNQQLLFHHYPATRDPFFAGYMTPAAIFRYPHTQHFRFHQRQLTLSPPCG